MKDLKDYLRFKFRQDGNWLKKLILLNILCFIGLLALKVSLVVTGYKAIYAALHHTLALPSTWNTFLQRPWTLLTHSWVHPSFSTIFWNLLLLYAFGRVIMQHLGSLHLVALYLLGGLVGGACFLLLYNVAPHFKETSDTLVGLAGSLYAVMVAAVLLAPQRPFQLLFGVIQLQYIVGVLVLLAFFNLVGEAPAESAAHLGGALLGYVYVQQQKGFIALRQRWRQLTSRRSTLKVTYRKASSASQPPHHTEE